MTRTDNPQHDLAHTAATLAREAGVRVTGIDTPAGLEAARLAPARAPRIAVAMDRPTRASSYGHIWYTLERIHGFDFTALNFEQLRTIELDRYDTIILPDGTYDALHPAIAADIAAALRGWVERGGTLVGVRGASAWLASEQSNIARARLRPASTGGSGDQPVVPGTIFRATVTDPASPLSYGYETQRELPVMVWSDIAFDPATTPDAPIRIAAGTDARLSGFAFPESLEHVGGTPYVVRERHGQGAVVLFLDDPLFRLFWDGLSRMFFNAVLYGSH
jgi:hypothetical protein